MRHAFSYDHGAPSFLDHHGHVDDNVSNLISYVGGNDCEWVSEISYDHDSIDDTLPHVHEKNVCHVPWLV